MFDTYNKHTAQRALASEWVQAIEAIIGQACGPTGIAPLDNGRGFAFDLHGLEFKLRIAPDGIAMMGLGGVQIESGHPEFARAMMIHLLYVRLGSTAVDHPTHDRLLGALADVEARGRG